MSIFAEKYCDTWVQSGTLWSNKLFRFVKYEVPSNSECWMLIVLVTDSGSHSKDRNHQGNVNAVEILPLKMNCDLLWRLGSCCSWFLSCWPMCGHVGKSCYCHVLFRPQVPCTPSIYCQIASSFGRRCHLVRYAPRGQTRCARGLIRHMEGLPWFPAYVDMFRKVRRHG